MNNLSFIDSIEKILKLSNNFDNAVKLHNVDMMTYIYNDMKEEIIKFDNKFGIECPSQLIDLLYECKNIIKAIKKPNSDLNFEYPTLLFYYDKTNISHYILLNEWKYFVVFNGNNIENQINIICFDCNKNNSLKYIKCPSISIIKNNTIYYMSSNKYKCDNITQFVNIVLNK
jgi:hypothetical protein